MSAEQINFNLSRFVLEVRRQDGEPYPPRSLYIIMCGILRHLRESEVSFNFFDEKDVRFHQLQRTLDAQMKQLTKEGKGCQKKQAEPITPAKEDLLWTTGQLGDSTSQSMINTVFFYNSKLFGLRAMDKHRGLACEQFEVGEDNHGKYIKFDGRSTKTLTGGLRQRNLSAKSIRHYSTVSDSSRCLHKIYSSYLEAIGNTGVFYRRPLPGKRFSKQPMGVNKLSIIVKSMCKNANIPGYFTNHSGKRTCATALFREGVDEQLIIMFSHRASQHGRPCVQATIIDTRETYI